VFISSISAVQVCFIGAGAVSGWNTCRGGVVSSSITPGQGSSHY